MQFNVLYLARLREAFGRRAETIELPSAGAPTAGDLIDALRARGGVWAAELAAGRAVRIAINHEMSPPTAPIREGDEIALFPPVTGG